MTTQLEAGIKYQPLAVGEIRLLYLDLQELHRQGEIGPDEIVVYGSLKHTVLHKDLQYNAISYMWGDAGVRKFIFMDGVGVSVTRNLARALEDVILNVVEDSRNPTMGSAALPGLPVWVDALCINQSDDREKSDQVKRMGDIYMFATNVLVFPEQVSSAIDTSEAFLIIWDLARLPTNPEWKALMDVASNSSTTDAEQCAESYRSVMAPILDRSANSLECLQRFARRENSWWERAWVLQEVMLADPNDIRIVHRRDWLEWGALVSARWARSTEMEAFEANGINRLLSVLPKKQRQAWFEVRDAFVNINQFFRITNISEVGQRTLAANLYWIRFCSSQPPKASVPHDLIYSLLSLSVDRDMCGILPDYNKSWQDVFRDVAVYMLSTEGSLALQCCWYREDDHDLPYSWIANWNYVVHRTPFHLWGSRPPYIASGSEGKFWFEASGFKLRLRARYFDRVEAVGGLGSKFATVAWSPANRIGTSRIWLKDFEQWLNSQADALEHRRMSAWRIPIADSDVSQMQLVRADLNLKEGFHALMHSESKSGHETEATQSYAECLSHTVGKNSREPFVTEQRRMGIGPPTIRAGDLICVILGHGVPLVLRKTGSERYRMIGEAFVEGVMDGELAGDNADYKKITIV